MALNVVGGACDDATRPTKCSIALGQKFTLTVDALAIPAAGYVGALTYIDFGNDLAYNATPFAVDEIVWPDCSSAIALRSQPSPASVNHGCLTGLFPPLPTSFFVGSLVEISLTCSAGNSSTLVRLLPEGDPVAGTSGALFITLVGGQVVSIVPVVNDLTINCGP